MRVFLFLLLFAMLAACRQKTEQTVSAPDEVAALAQHRAVKDSLFQSAAWSPIKEEERSSFAGLKYFESNDQMKFSGSIYLHDNPQKTEIYATKSGDVRPAETFGYFQFVYNDSSYQLEILKIFSKNDSTQTHLFLGFTDETTGNETYGAGRYIDLTENEENFYIVDFNYAYNPYCAYNEKYSCALPPAANRLPFRIPAGEKIYSEH